MKGLSIFFIIVILIFSCSKNGKSELEPKTLLLGKWEADYKVFENDTTFYIVGSSTPCAYAILDLEYNSGFEFSSESTGDLIWCGENKGQYFDWNYEIPNLEFGFNAIMSTLKVSDLSETSMYLYREDLETTWHLVKK